MPERAKIFQQRECHPLLNNETRSAKEVNKPHTERSLLGFVGYVGVCPTYDVNVDQSRQTVT